MALLIKSVLAVVLLVAINDANAMNCEEDMSRWFLANGEWTGDLQGKPDNQRLIVDRELKAFGETWSDGYKVKIRKGRASGEVRINPTAGWRQPGAFAIRASRMPYNTSHLGHMRVRMTTAERDISEIETIIKDAYPCLTTGNFRPNHAIVVTYTCMLHYHEDDKERDTFQVVVAGNSKRTFAIVQYHHLHGRHFIQFGFLERLGRNKHKFTQSRFDRADELLHSTNGVRKGLWVFDITDKVPRTPELCPKEPNECTVTDNGLVHSFDGVTQVAPAEFLSVLATTELDFSDDCNFENRIHMEKNGEVKFFELFVGAILDANPEDRFYFTFDRKEGTVRLRGPGLRKAEKLTFPYRFKEGNTDIVVRENSQGWKLLNEKCDYSLIFRPDGQEPVYRLTVGPSYAGLLDGYCENFDGNAVDDRDTDFL